MSAWSVAEYMKIEGFESGNYTEPKLLLFEKFILFNGNLL